MAHERHGLKLDWKLPTRSSAYASNSTYVKLSKCDAGGLGGAVAVDASQATVGGSIFSGNSAESQGGALYQVSSQL